MDSRRLDEKLAPAMEEAEIAQVWRGVKEARADAPARRRRVVGIGVAIAAMAAAAAVAVVVMAGSGDAGRGSVTGGGGAQASAGGGELATGRVQGSAVGSQPGATVASGGGARGPITSADLTLDPGVRVKPAAERSIAMDDGSVVALAAASELEVLANETDKFVTAVRKGWAHFDVNPGGGRRWVIETDLATVEVVGTAFVVERAETHLVVKVERGVVLVRGERVPGRIVRLTAGEALEVPAQVAIAPAPVAPAPVGPARVAAPPVRADRSVAVDGRSPPTASVDVPATSVPAAESAIARADALLARGKAIDAADELERFLDDAGNDAGAGLAAFMLGRIAQDQLGDPDRAAAAFARTLAIGSPRAVQDEARARRTRALAAAGRTE
ncbi:MAG TPA: FecR family protein [Kofleriaceae bacterium]|nr:FecR family protein [Kofleriaceae bacterium]